MIFYFIFFCVLNLCWASEKIVKGHVVSSDFNLTTAQIIRKHGYPVEVHEVETEDGYILELHRIPHGKNSTSTRGTPMLLAHGLIGTSAQYVMLDSESLAFILADEGYDIWLINFRGCKYSKKHKVLSPDYMKFWDFSLSNAKGRFHEHGVYDIPASIDYVLRHTQRQELLYIGYSMGTTSFFIMSSVRPEYQKKIRGAILIGPTAYIGHAKTPMRRFASFSKTLRGGLEFIGHEEIFKHSTEQRVNENSCREHVLCRTIFYFLSGSNRTEFDSRVLPIIASHMPASTSVKTIAHFGQLMASGKFQYYDYGIVKNMMKYRQWKPPEYRLQATTLPLSLFISPNDYFNSRDDQERTLRLLPNVKSAYIVPQHTFTHLDFVVSRNAKKLVYGKIVEQAKYLIDHGHK